MMALIGMAMGLGGLFLFLSSDGTIWRIILGLYLVVAGANTIKDSDKKPPTDQEMYDDWNSRKP